MPNAEAPCPHWQTKLSATVQSRFYTTAPRRGPSAAGWKNIQKPKGDNEPSDAAQLSWHKSSSWGFLNSLSSPASTWNWCSAVTKTWEPCVGQSQQMSHLKENLNILGRKRRPRALSVPFNQCTPLKIKLAVSEYKSPFPKYTAYYLARSPKNSQTPFCKRTRPSASHKLSSRTNFSAHPVPIIRYSHTFQLKNFLASLFPSTRLGQDKQWKTRQ